MAHADVLSDILLGSALPFCDIFAFIVICEKIFLHVDQLYIESIDYLKYRLCNIVYVFVDRDE